MTYLASGCNSADEFWTLCSSFIASQTGNSQSAAVAIHLADPSTPAQELARRCGLRLDEIRSIYKSLQSNTTLASIVSSPFYSRRLMWQFAVSVLSDWTNDIEYAGRVLSREEIASRILEIHSTKGTCDYACTMCLWSDKYQFTYESRRLEEEKVLDSQHWKEILSSAYELGSRIAVFSGGGEPLLNSELFTIVSAAHKIGFRTQLYTNGYAFQRLSEKPWQEILSMEQIRFSIHSPDDATYHKIVKLPTRTEALTQVRLGIAELMQMKRTKCSSVRVGIGFVVQPLNYRLVVDMAEFASNLQVDFLNIRCDEVDVTRSFRKEETEVLYEQLNTVRSRFIRGDFGLTSIDMSDDLVAFANGRTQSLCRTSECMVKFFRPAVSPYGVFAPCDLKAEPRFADEEHVLGRFQPGHARLTLINALPKKIKANCDQCMPSGRTANSIYAKLISDIGSGISFGEQPFSLSTMPIR